MAASRYIPRLTRPLFLMCDIQEGFEPVMKNIPQLSHASATLIRAANLFSAPVLASEQYPKGLGNTVKALQPFLRYPDEYSRLPESTAAEDATVQVFEKTAFSMVGDELKAMCERSSPAYDSVVLWGMETHVCVLQTALDLLQHNPATDVFLVTDAVCSQRQADREAALQRMTSMGVIPTTVEAVLFEMTQDAKAPQFKAISKLAKEYAAGYQPIHYN